MGSDLHVPRTTRAYLAQYLHVLSTGRKFAPPFLPPPSLTHTGLHDETDKALKEAVHSRLIDQAKLEALQAEQRELARSLREAQQARFTAVLLLLY